MMTATALRMATVLIVLPLVKGHNAAISRRHIVARASHAALFLAPTTLLAPSIASGGDLSARMAARDASQLKKSIFNLAPGPIEYPSWLLGTWNVTATFSGFELPSSSISKSKVLADVEGVPGFQKLSVATFADVGKSPVAHTLRFAPSRRAAGALEDRPFNLRSSINAYLGLDAVDTVTCENDNRATVIFKPRRTRNAEKIELFTNSRGAETTSDESFVCFEQMRQVTIGYSREYGVARQVIGEYAHFWTYRRDGEFVRANALTCGYLQPQDNLFFDSPDRPVIVYSHDLQMRPVDRADPGGLDSQMRPVDRADDQVLVL